MVVLKLLEGLIGRTFAQVEGFLKPKSGQLKNVKKFSSLPGKL